MPKVVPTMAEISERSNEGSHKGSVDIVQANADFDLQEDDEIDDDTHIPQSTTEEPISDHHKSEVIEYPNVEGSTSGRATGRKPRSGSIHALRTRARARRAVGVDKNWGNASTPAISIKDLMGGEKKATQVGKSFSSHSRPGRTGPQVRPDMKIQRIKTRKVAKKDRRKEVKNSLAHFLVANQSEESDNRAEEEAEDESLISEENEEEPLKQDPDHSSDDDKSIKSQKSQSRRRRRQRRTTNEEGGSSHSRKRAPRRNRSKEDADDATVGSRRSRRANRRLRDVGDDGSRRRSTEESRSMDPPRSRRQNSKNKGDEKKPRSLRKMAEDDDDRSVSSKKSVGRRRRLRSDATKSRKKSGSPSRPPKEVGNATAPVSPLVQPAEKIESVDQLASLANHIESDPKPKDKEDPEEASEESSRFSHGGYTQTTLLQFDPTNADNVVRIDQGKANKTSEKVRHADGTEAELQISELAGLPTFEAPATFHDSVASNFNEALDPISHNSMGSLDYTEGLVDSKIPSSTQSLGSARDSSIDEGTAGQKAGERSQSDEKNLETGVGTKRGVRKTRSGGRQQGVSATRSFLSRRRNQRPDKSESVEEVGDASQKGSFFSGWGKKEREESDSDDEPKARFGFQKREPKGMGHQALDDDGSEGG